MSAKARRPAAPAALVSRAGTIRFFPCKGGREVLRSAGRVKVEVVEPDRRK